MPYGILTTGSPYWPNPWSASVAPGVSAWRVLGYDPVTKVTTPYASRAAMFAAEDRQWPGLDQGGKIGQCLMQALTSGGAVGSGVLYKLDPATAPTTIADADNEVDGDGQQISLPCPFREIWIYMLASTDTLKLSGRY